MYRLALAGHMMLSDGRFTPRRRNIDHSLGIAECLVMLRQAERAGHLVVDGVDFEPATHLTLGGAELKPDMYARLEHARRGLAKFWFEVDMATEGPAQIHGKLRRYIRAFSNYSELDMERVPSFPLVLWVAVDNERAEQLRRYILELEEHEREMFRVTSFAELPNFLK